MLRRSQEKFMTAIGAIPYKSIAVLPFENLSEEKANAYFADGTQNEILTKLAGIGDLKVISRTSSAKYKSKPENLKTVARELGVATVLEGTVQKAGDKVRVNVQLLDARSDTHLWAKSYDRNFTIFLQSRATSHRRLPIRYRRSFLRARRRPWLQLPRVTRKLMICS
jgi:TolB-like protein